MGLYLIIISVITSIFGLKYNVVWTDSVVQMISAFIKQMLNPFCLLNFPDDFLQTLNGLQINIIRILSRITAKIKFLFELPLILTEMIIK